MPEVCGGAIVRANAQGRTQVALRKDRPKRGREGQGAGNARCDRWTRPGLPGFVSDQSLEMRMHDWQRRSTAVASRKRERGATLRRPGWWNKSREPAESRDLENVHWPPHENAQGRI